MPVQYITFGPSQSSLWPQGLPAGGEEGAEGATCTAGNVVDVCEGWLLEDVETDGGLKDSSILEGSGSFEHYTVVYVIVNHWSNDTSHNAATAQVIRSSRVRPH
jgi:hypothetical protein